MSLLDLFVKHSKVTILIAILMSILGYNSYINIPKESTPDVKVPMIYAVAPLDGISPQDAERLLLKPMENAIKNIDGIKEINGYASEGNAMVLAEFQAGFNSDKALQDMRIKIEEAEALMPIDVKKPIVHEINLSLFPVLNIILSGDLPIRSVLKISRDLRNQIEGLEGVLDVKISGDRIDSLEVIVKPEMLESYKIPISSIQSIINSNNRLIAAGAIENKSGNFAIKIPSLINDFRDLLDFPMQTHNGAVVTLGDVCDIKRTFKEPKSTALVNGKPAVVLEVSKRTGHNIINTVASVKSLMQAQSFPSNLLISYAGDQSHEIIDMVTDLENNILIASTLVILMVILFIGFRSSLIICLSIPFSFLSAILLLYLLGYTLNVVVLFSLILTIGMVVDDAIVVSEYADRLMHQGIASNEAFLIAAKRMLWPVITSTLVKIIVFLPLLFWPGVVGQFMKYMPITAIVILSGSLVFALFFQPTLGPLFFGKALLHKGEDVINDDYIEVEKLDKFSLYYHNLLCKILSHPKKFVCSVMAILFFVYGFFISFGTGIEFFPKVEPESIHVSVMTSGNLSLREKESIIHDIAGKISKYDNEIKIIYATSGNPGHDFNASENTIGKIFIEYHNWQIRRKSKAIIADLKKEFSQFKGVDFQILENSSGPPPEKPIYINIIANSSENDVIADNLVKFMQNSDKFAQIDDSRASGLIEWRLIFNRSEAARYNVDIISIGNTVRMISNGLKISSFRPEDVEEEVDILVRFPEDYRNIESLKSLSVINPQGKVIPISYFVKIEPATQTNTIKRVNKNKVITIKSDVKEGFLVNDGVIMLQKWVKDNNYDEKIVFKGEDKDQKETGNFLKNAFILTLIMMFIIMLMQFDNYYHTIVVMSAVFLSTVGVLIGLIMTWQPFGIVMCGVGIIALGGIVLNNNILFIDTYQYLRKRNIEIETAVITAGVQRLRPIMLTALTAILGLLPMVFGITINVFEFDATYDAPSSQWWRQLAASIAGGLSFATILTLFFTPCLLLLGKKFDHFGKQ